MSAMTLPDARIRAVETVRGHFQRFLAHGILLIPVMDGDPFPAKLDAQRERRRMREESAKKLEEAMAKPPG